MSVACIRNLSLRYGKFTALDTIDLDIPAGCLVGIIGPDGVGKSSLLSLVSGAREIQQGKIELFDGDMGDLRHRENVCPRIAYMPQGLGKNLYATLSVFENIDFFGSLFGLQSKARRERIYELLEATGLAPFKDRPAGKLSGGMRQKLGICCALIHEPDLLILDEPTTGVDPLSRRLFWELIGQIRKMHTEMSLLVATAYMEEAAHFDWLVAMHNGRLLFTGKVDAFLTRNDSVSLERAFISLLPEDERRYYKPVVLVPRESGQQTETFIEAKNLTKRFGDFTAVDHVNFQIESGEIFGFLGSNGCGKTTTMKMLTGLLPPSEGMAKLFGHVLNSHDLATRKRVGYMSQSFSLYTELTVEQNLILHARLFNIPEEQIGEKVEKTLDRFGLTHELHSLPENIPLGLRQRLSLAVAMIHSPDILILDEPTSGVDPIARDAFWQFMLDLSRKDGVTIFISTHYMNEAERCDRVSLMHAGKVLASDKPSSIIEQCQASTLEEAFIKLLEGAGVVEHEPKSLTAPAPVAKLNESGPSFSLRRMGSYIQREALDIYRDATRFTLSIIGSVLLMLAFGFGITLDVENLSFAVLDRDQSPLSRDYIYNIAGSRYFTERPPIKDYKDLNQRMRNGDISLAIEIPHGFARDVGHGKPVSIGSWIDGAMPRRAEVIRGYFEGINMHWLNHLAKSVAGVHIQKDPVEIETRYLYNPDVKSVNAMVPAAFAIVLMMIPAILTTLSVVREKELGTIVNLYISPITRLEFLIGKQIPYVVLAMASFLLMSAAAYFIFGVAIRGSFLALLLGTLLFVATSTSIGLLVSTFTKSQTAAIFATSVLTILPTINFSGLLDPISSLDGVGAFIGKVFPATYYLEIARGAYSKGLDFKSLSPAMLPLMIATPILLWLSAAFLRKQER